MFNEKERQREAIVIGLVPHQLSGIAPVSGYLKTTVLPTGKIMGNNDLENINYIANTSGKKRCFLFPFRISTAIR